MQIFVFDLGHRGAEIVIADNLEEAQKIVNSADGSFGANNAQLEVFPIVKGQHITIFGDR